MKKEIQKLALDIIRLEEQLNRGQNVDQAQKEIASIMQSLTIEESFELNDCIINILNKIKR